MGIRIKDKIEAKTKLEYPFYGITTSGHAVVYFTKESCGVCIATESDLRQIGEYATDWFMGGFTLIPKGKTIEIDT